MRNDPARIQIELTKLETGERLLCLTDPKSGLSLERKLDPEKPVITQKEKLLAVFEAPLSKEEPTRRNNSVS